MLLISQAESNYGTISANQSQVNERKLSDTPKSFELVRISSYSGKSIVKILTSIDFLADF